MITHLREAISDRQVLTMMVAVAVVGLVFIVYIVTNLQYRDTPVVTHYTSYGSQHLYDYSWYEMLSFIGFALTVVVGHSVLMVKLSRSKNKNTAFVLCFATLMVLVIAFMVAHQVLRVAVL